MDLRASPTIRCANPGDGRPRHGMFVGTGAVAAGTQFCQQAFNAKGVKGNWATFATLASAVSKTVFIETGSSRRNPPRPALRHRR